LQTNSDVVKNKEYVVLVLEDLSSITIFSLNLLDIIVRLIQAFPESWKNTHKPIILISNNIELQKYPVIRKIGKTMFKINKIKKDTLDEIIDTGKIIHKF